MMLQSTRKASGARGFSGVVIAVLLSAVTACASSFEAPEPLDETALRERAVTASEDGIRVAAAIPASTESITIFGVDLADVEVQPLWLEIENGTDRDIAFLPTGLDPEYFSPLEVAYLFESELTEAGHAVLSSHLEALNFNSRSLIEPGETVSGFVYANRADPSMLVKVDLIGRKWSKRIGLLVPVPGTEVARQRIEALGRLYTDADIIRIEDEAALRKALEALPCCMVDRVRDHDALPLNLVLIGEIEDLGPAFARQRYRFRSLPPGFAFGRKQDFSARKSSRWIEPQPHMLRVWLTPLRYRGKPIWLGQVSMNLGGRFPPPVTKDGPLFEPDVDQARNDVIEDLLYSQAIVKIGFVKGAGASVPSENQNEVGGQVYRGDGLRAVMVFSNEATAFSNIDFFEWESLAGGAQARTE